MQKLSLIDQFLVEIDHSFKTCFAKPPLGERAYPADKQPFTELSETESSHTSGLMRINNAGEVAAQGLYRGQAITAREESIKQEMLQASDEENDHLNWCQSRLEELGAKRSLLDPFWYWGSFAIGSGAGLLGDQWSLGFVEETENQVTRHLEDHLERLPEQDQRSKAILTQMKEDEMKHAHNAHQLGAAELPSAIKTTMKWVSKLMTTTAYRI